MALSFTFYMDMCWFTGLESQELLEAVTHAMRAVIQKLTDVAPDKVGLCLKLGSCVMSIYDFCRSRSNCTKQRLLFDLHCEIC